MNCAPRPEVTMQYRTEANEHEAEEAYAPWLGQ
jgi:hypothetical protein